jgi:hypothetical protein
MQIIDKLIQTNCFNKEEQLLLLAIKACELEECGGPVSQVVYSGKMPGFENIDVIQTLSRFVKDKHIDRYIIESRGEDAIITIYP